MIYSGVGSRQVPDSIYKEMVQLGKYLAEAGHYIRSGHAEGCDYAFEEGAREHCLVYLPWKGFNSKFPLLGKSVVVPDEPRYIAMVHKFHPNPSALSRGAIALMGRNSCQVLGLNLDKPVKAVLCYTPEGKFIGGTSQAMRIAVAHKIPIINMGFEKYKTAELVVNELNNI